MRSREQLRRAQQRNREQAARVVASMSGNMRALQRSLSPTAILLSVVDAGAGCMRHITTFRRYYRLVVGFFRRA